MSVTDGPAPATWVLEEYPAFDLRYRFDDAVEPLEVTVFPSDTDEVTTAWITADVEDAVPIEDAR